MGFVDLVIGGPDMSGTSTQIEDVSEYFLSKGKVVRDIRGTEIDALFHSEKFQARVGAGWDDYFINLRKFLSAVVDTPSSLVSARDFLWDVNELLGGGGTNQDLRVASMVENNVSTYVNPDSADVWIMEEPTKRGAGQVNRVIEQNRSSFGSEIDPVAAAETHSVYRTDEFLRFRGPLRVKGKTVVRSRSEESACYQIFDEKNLPNGVPRDYYFNLAGHKVAFANPPTHIFVVCGPESWTEKDYLKLKKERSGDGRSEDDYERMAGYQVLVNRRYATDWLEGLYKEGCGKFGVEAPKITRFNIYDFKSEIKAKMASELEKICRA